MTGPRDQDTAQGKGGSDETMLCAGPARIDPRAIAGAVLQRAPRPAIFLDFDGTLVDLAPTPDAIHVPSDLATLLRRLKARYDGAVAVISGRGLSDIDRHIGLDGLFAAGQHGLEGRGPRDLRWTEKRPDALDRIRAALDEFALERPGVQVEDKGLTIALHTRLAPHLDADAIAFVKGLAETTDGRWRLRPGHHVIEIGLGSADKGAALERLLTTPPFQGRIPVVFGDDLTDETAFAAAHRHGGVTIAVGDRPAEADLRLPAPAVVRAVLEHLAEGL